MYPVSEQFAATVIGPHVAVVRAQVVLMGQAVAELKILSGSVSIDARRDGALRTLSLTVAPDETAWAALTTFGAEIKVWRGIMLETGEEIVPLGVFVIDADLDQPNNGAVSISAADRSQRIARARWADPYTVAAGGDLGTAVAALLVDRWPGCPLGFSTLGIAVAAQLVLQAGADSNPWKDARAMVAAAGLDLYFDGDGTARIRTIPDPASVAPAVTYYPGELSVVVAKKRTAMLSSTSNGVIASGEGTGVDTPPRGEAWDDDPNSPTYRYGPMGQVPEFFSSPLLTTTAACVTAAQTRLARVRGRMERMSWDLVVNPAHEAFDVIAMVDAAGVTHRYMLDQVTIPLVATDPMPTTAREIRVS